MFLRVARRGCVGGAAPSARRLCGRWPCAPALVAPYAPAASARRGLASGPPQVPPAVLRAGRVVAAAVRQVAIVAVPAIGRVGSQLAASQGARVAMRNARTAVDGALALLGKQYSAYIKEHFKKVVFAGSCVTLYYVMRKLLDFLGGFLTTVESSVWYLLQFGSVLSAAALALHVKGRYHLSARQVHRIASHLVSQSQESVIAQKLGGRIKADGNMRLVRRSGGGLRLAWPQSVEEQQQLREKVEMKARVAAATARVCSGSDSSDSSSAGDAVAPSTASLVVRARRKLAELRWQSKMAMDRLNIPHVEVKPERAHLVFPIAGSKGRGIVSVECVKHAGGLNGVYTFDLLSVDFADNTFTLLCGDEMRYNSEVLTQMRLPIVTWLHHAKQIEEAEEDEEEEEVLQQSRATA